jgi:hypothetical protein
VLAPVESHGGTTDNEIDAALDAPIDSHPLDEVILSGDSVLMSFDATRDRQRASRQSAGAPANPKWNQPATSPSSSPRHSSRGPA